MSLKWNKNSNLYTHNPFALVEGLPFDQPRVLQQKGKTVAQRALRSGGLEINGVEFTEQEVAQAANQLNEPAGRAEALALCHLVEPVDAKQTRRLETILNQIVVGLPVQARLRLKSPRHVFWFLNLPGEELIAEPPWEALGIGEAGDEEDLARDIVFDV